MIVSTSRKFILVHIPKTAGTSVSTVLARIIDPVTDVHFSRKNWRPDNLHKAGLNPEIKLSKHATVRQIVRAMGQEAFYGYYSFSFSRNPFSRVLSGYGFIRKKAINIAAGKKLNGKPLRPPLPGQPDISAFLEMSFDELCQNLTSIQTKVGLFKPQVHWLHSEGCVSFTGRIENLEKDLADILDEIGVPEADRIDLPHRNKTSEPDAWRNMSYKSARAIRAFYAADFDRFGYSTDLGAGG